MQLETVKKTIEVYLKKFIQKEIAADDEIITSGLVNSLFAMQLILFIEKEFDLKIGNEDLDIKNFNSLNAISRFVGNKKGLMM